MSVDQLTIGFLPLVDAALPILAQELGFAEQESLSLDFIRDISWASVRDRLLYGQSDCAHLLAPLAISTTLGLGRPPKALSVPFVLGLNGNAITMSLELADKVAPKNELGQPYAVGKLLKAEVAVRKQQDRKVRLGVVHRYSSHNYKLRYWLAECGIHPDIDVEIVTIAPPFAADALGSSEVDAICVGEPWNSVAVERGIGRIVLVTAQIWKRGVEKVLAMPTSMLDEKRPQIERLIRALHTTARDFVNPENWDRNAAILARNEYLDGSATLIRRAISDHIMLRSGTEPVHIPDFMFQYREAANFPWISQAAWLYSQMVRWDALQYDAVEQKKAESVFRPDIYRAALSGIDAPMPSANAKVEGAVQGPLAVGASQGSLTLSSDPFFNGQTFDLNEVEAYLGNMPNN